MGRRRFTYAKLFATALVIAGLLATLSGCGSGAGSGGESAEGGDGTTIGVSTWSRRFEFYQRVEEGMQEAADGAGISLQLRDANGDLATQTADVENFVSQNVDLIIIEPIDSEGAAAVVQRANQAGIPLMTVDIAVEGEGVDVATHVASDNLAGGGLAAEYMGEALGGSGQIAVINNPTITSVIDREDGFKREMNASYSDVEIVATQSGQSERQTALRVTEDLLQANPGLDGIFAVNDEMALGALQAVQTAGEPAVNIIGFDASEEALDAVAAGGPFKASVAQQPVQMGRVAIETAQKVLDDEQVPEFVPIDVELVNEDNLGRYR